jgi:hypothetical protein
MKTSHMLRDVTAKEFGMCNRVEMNVVISNNHLSCDDPRVRTEENAGSIRSSFDPYSGGNDEGCKPKSAPLRRRTGCLRLSRLMVRCSDTDKHCATDVRELS